jgi:hypothetical protein
VGDRAGAHPYFRHCQRSCEPPSKDRLRLRIESWDSRIHRLYRMKAVTTGRFPQPRSLAFSRVKGASSRVNDLDQRERASTAPESSHRMAVPVGFSLELKARGSRVNDLDQEGACLAYARKQSSNGGSRNLAHCFSRELKALGSRVNDLDQEGACLDLRPKAVIEAARYQDAHSWIET